MRFPAKPIVFVCIFCVFCRTPSVAQEPAPVYNGMRISLLDFELLQVRGKTAMLKCRIANTGRLETGQKKNAAQTVVELDTLGLPSILRGHETEVSAVAANNIPKLKPGEISGPIWLDVTAKDPVMPPPSAGACADLRIDTAYIVRYKADEIMLRYVVSNGGNIPVEIAGRNLQLMANVYFISGTKLTRGAIPAGNTAVTQGRETLTGWLRPGQKISGEVAVVLKNRTKFAPNLLLELAPPSSLIECDRTNNTRSIAVPF